MGPTMRPEGTVAKSPFSCLVALHVNFSSHDLCFLKKMDVAKRLGPFNISKVPKTKKCAKTGLLVLRVKMKNKGDYLENPHNQLKIHIHVLNKLPNIKEYDVINYKIHGCFTCISVHTY
jgi:hypothetical protein